ncbi:MAG: hypothetical protein ABR925_08850 [Acidimicrobiales bacterium]|jgi:hypothetical protein
MSDIISYRHLIHPHTRDVLGGAVKPTRTNDHRVQGKSGFARFNARVGLMITLGVGTMICAYIFAIVALISLPSAIKSHDLTIIIAWISSNFLQLVLLPIIIVGQNIQAAASDKRAEDTYKDAEAVLHEAVEIQKHLSSQDTALTELVDKLRGMATAGA